MRNLNFILVLFTILIISCKKDKEDENKNISKESGDINIIVKYDDGSFAENAVVFEKYNTISDTTDEFGSVLFTNIKCGSYEFYAQVDTVGSGKATFEVLANQLSEIEITIVKGVFYPDSIQNFELYVPVVQEGKVKLTWSKYMNSGFSKYEIYRSSQGCFEEYLEFIGEVNNLEDTTFIDEYPPIEYQACYAVKAININGHSVLSNLYSVDNPSGIIFSYVPDEMFKHPDESIAYLVDYEALKLVKYDYINDTILHQVNIHGDIGYCDIGDNGFGVEIYIPTYDGKVYVYNADDLSLAATISTELPATCAVSDELGHIIVSVVPSPWWEQPIRTFSRSNGMNLDGSGEMDFERLKKIPGKNEYISITEGVSPTDMNHYEFSTSGYFIAENDDDYHGDYPLRASIFRISDNGEYVITSNNGSVYLANSNMLYQGNLHNGNLYYSDFAFSTDCSTIFAATSNRKSIQIGKYPELIRENEIPLKGYPQKIIRDNNKLIVIITPEEENPIKSSIQVVDIP